MAAGRWKSSPKSPSYVSPASAPTAGEVPITVGRCCRTDRSSFAAVDHLRPVGWVDVAKPTFGGPLVLVVGFAASTHPTSARSSSIISRDGGATNGRQRDDRSFRPEQRRRHR